MKILCNSKMPANLMVNKVGKYLKRTIDSAYKIKFSSNNCDVFMVVYYQTPVVSNDPVDPVGWSELMEMHLDINLTTYQNKVRVNIYEISPREVTIGHDVFLPESLTELTWARDEILDKIKKRISKYYRNYQFIF